MVIGNAVADTLCRRATILARGALTVCCRIAGWDAVASACESLASFGELLRDNGCETAEVVWRAVEHAAALVRATITSPDDELHLNTSERDRLMRRIAALPDGRLPGSRDIVDDDIDLGRLQYRLPMAIAAADGEFAPNQPPGQLVARILATAFDTLLSDAALIDRMRRDDATAASVIEQMAAFCPPEQSH